MGITSRLPYTLKIGYVHMTKVKSTVVNFNSYSLRWDYTRSLTTDFMFSTLSSSRCTYGLNVLTSSRIIIVLKTTNKGFKNSN